MSAANTVIGFVEKDLYIEQFALNWPITATRLTQREDRTMMREGDSPVFRMGIERIGYSYLHEVMLTHDLKVLAKWIERKLYRQKAILINEPQVRIETPTWDFAILKDVRVIQHAIRYDKDAFEQFGKRRVMVPKGQPVLTIAVMTDPPITAMAVE